MYGHTHIQCVFVYYVGVTSLHLHRRLSRSLFSSSSTTVTSGARSETTPRSSGRKGCGPSWARKEAKPKKLCLSVALAESVGTKVGTLMWQRQLPLALCNWLVCYLSSPSPFSTFQNSQNHIPVVHTSSVEGHGAVGTQREGAGQRGDQVEGLGQPLPRQLPWLDNGSVTGLKGLLLVGGQGHGCDCRSLGTFGDVRFGRVEGWVGVRHVQGDTLMFQNVNTWRSCEEKRQEEKKGHVVSGELFLFLMINVSILLEWFQWSLLFLHFRRQSHRSDKRTLTCNGFTHCGLSMTLLPSMPCSILLVVTLEAFGRMRLTLSGQNRKRKMKTIVTKKQASSRVGTMMTSCSYTRISGRQWQQAQSSLTLPSTGTKLACAPLSVSSTGPNFLRKKKKKTHHRSCLHAGSDSLIPIQTTFCCRLEKKVTRWSFHPVFLFTKPMLFDVT